MSYCHRCVNSVQMDKNILFPRFNTYDIGAPCIQEDPSNYNSGRNLCYNFTKLENFLNRDDVKKILNVDNVKNWVLCRKVVWKNLIKDMNNDASVQLATSKFFITFWGKINKK